jgi:hypothetical protein
MNVNNEYGQLVQLSGEIEQFVLENHCASSDY